MKGREQHMLSVLQFQQLYAQQWAAGELKGPPYFLSNQSPGCFFALWTWQWRQVNHVYCDRLRLSNHLHRLSGHDLKGGAQYFVPAHNLTKTLGQSRHVKLSLEEKDIEHVVRDVIGV